MKINIKTMLFSLLFILPCNASIENELADAILDHNYDFIVNSLENVENINFFCRDLKGRFQELEITNKDIEHDAYSRKADFPIFVQKHESYGVIAQALVDSSDITLIDVFYTALESKPYKDVFFNNVFNYALKKKNLYIAESLLKKINPNVGDMYDELPLNKALLCYIPEPDDYLKKYTLNKNGDKDYCDIICKLLNTKVHPLIPNKTVHTNALEILLVHKMLPFEKENLLILDAIENNLYNWEHFYIKENSHDSKELSRMHNNLLQRIKAIGQVNLRLLLHRDLYRDAAKVLAQNVGEELSQQMYEKTIQRLDEAKNHFFTGKFKFYIDPKVINTISQTSSLQEQEESIVGALRARELGISALPRLKKPSEKRINKQFFLYHETGSEEFYSSEDEEEEEYTSSEEINYEEESQVTDIPESKQEI